VLFLFEVIDLSDAPVNLRDMKTAITLLGGFAAGLVLALLVAAIMDRPGVMLAEARDQAKKAEVERDRLQSELDSARRERQAVDTNAASVAAERDKVALELATVKDELASLKSTKASSPDSQAAASQNNSKNAGDGSPKKETELPDLRGFNLEARHATIDLGESRLEITIESPLIYLPNEGTKKFYAFVTPKFFVGDREQPATEGFYKINGKAESIVYSSSNELVMSAEKFGAEFKEAGDAILSVSIVGKTVSMPIHVVRLPFGDQHTAQDIIKLLGLPDRQKEVHASWPNGAIEDGISYSPNLQYRYIDANYWRYDRFPGLVISVIYGLVSKIHTNVESERNS
jgi:hypothetical protein